MSNKKEEVGELAISLNFESQSADKQISSLNKLINRTEKEFKSAIKMDNLKSARPRLILSQSILQKINSKNGNVGDYVSFLYYFQLHFQSF